MKRLKYMLFILPLIVFITGCEVKDNDNYDKIDEEQSTPLLFEVTRDDSDNILYLFGSIHVGDSSLYPLPDYVKNAYEKSDAIAVEFDITEYTNDLNKQLELLQLYIAEDGNTIMDLLGEEEYEKLKNILDKRGLYNSAYEIYSPDMWESLLSNALSNDAKLYSSLGIDNHILKKAKKDDKKILELESAEYQINMLNSVDKEYRRKSFIESIDRYDEAVDALKELYELYKKGNRKDLEESLAEENNVEGSEEYNKILLYDRNTNMALKLDNYFKEDMKVFCTVGLAHIIGDKSIIEILEDKGYTIKQID